MWIEFYRKSKDNWDLFLPMKVVLATKAKVLMLLKLDFGKVIIMSTLKTLGLKHRNS